VFSGWRGTRRVGTQVTGTAFPYNPVIVGIGGRASESMPPSVYGLGMPRRKRKGSGPQPTAKPQSSDQAPGEEVVQVNDKYRGGEPAPDMQQEEQAQHQTGG
jgi:hypothetical protein